MHALREQRDIWKAQFKYHLERKPDSKETKCWTYSVKGVTIFQDQLRIYLHLWAVQALVFGLILLNIGAVGLRIPQYKGTAVHTAGVIICLICNSFFLIESLCRILAFGVIRNHDPPYWERPFFRSKVNTVDLAITIWMLVDPAVQYLAVFRVVRLLRMGSSDTKIATHFKLLSGTLVASFSGILVVLLVIVFQVAPPPPRPARAAECVPGPRARRGGGPLPCRACPGRARGGGARGPPAAEGTAAMDTPGASQGLRGDPRAPLRGCAVRVLPRGYSSPEPQGLLFNNSAPLGVGGGGVPHYPPAAPRTPHPHPPTPIP